MSTARNRRCLPVADDDDEFCSALLAAVAVVRCRPLVDAYSCCWQVAGVWADGQYSWRSTSRYSPCEEKALMRCQWCGCCYSWCCSFRTKGCRRPTNSMSTWAEASRTRRRCARVCRAIERLSRRTCRWPPAFCVWWTRSARDSPCRTACSRRWCGCRRYSCDSAPRTRYYSSIQSFVCLHFQYVFKMNEFRSHLYVDIPFASRWVWCVRRLRRDSRTFSWSRRWDSETSCRASPRTRSRRVARQTRH